MRQFYTGQESNDTIICNIHIFSLPKDTIKVDLLVSG